MKNTPTTAKGRQALSLAQLRLCGLDLAASHRHAMAAVEGLTGSRLARATQLCELLADAIAFCRRLSVVVEGDLRADVEEQR